MARRGKTSKQPDGWITKPLGKVAIIQGGFAFKSHKLLTDRKPFQVVRMSSFYQGQLDLTRNPAFIECPTDKELNSLLREGDIVITLTGTVGKQDYGYVVQIRNEPNLLLNQRLARVIAEDDKACKAYLKYALCDTTFKDHFFLCARGGTGNQANVGTEDLRSIPIPLPPLPEQKKIAEILGCWDKAIEQTEKLIEAKTKLKKGLMQQLFGRDEEGLEWTESRLGDICTVLIGGTPSRKKPEYWDNECVTENHWVSIRDIGQKHLSNTSEKISDLGIKKSNVKLIQPGTVIVSFKLTLGRASIVKVTCYTNEAIAALVPKRNDLNQDFLYYLLGTIDFDSYVDQAVKGKTLNKSKMETINVSIPDSDEQNRIASILSLADDSIEQLRSVKDLITNQKKGLMQKLLTGKIRVKVLPDSDSNNPANSKPVELTRSTENYE